MKSVNHLWTHVKGLLSMCIPNLRFVWYYIGFRTLFVKGVICTWWIARQDNGRWMTSDEVLQYWWQGTHGEDWCLPAPLYSSFPGNWKPSELQTWNYHGRNVRGTLTHHMRPQLASSCQHSQASRYKITDAYNNKYFSWAFHAGSQYEE